MTAPVVTFIENGSRMAVEGILCTVTAVYTDGSGFIARDDQSRVLVIRSKGELNSWTLGGRKVEVIPVPRRGVDELIGIVRENFRALGLYPPAQ